MVVYKLSLCILVCASVCKITDEEIAPLQIFTNNGLLVALAQESGFTSSYSICMGLLCSEASLTNLNGLVVS